MKLLHIQTSYNDRVFGLDLMRAIAIVIVVMGHGRMLEVADTNFPWIKLPDGVELFFVLSGFLIGSILIKQFKKPSFNVHSLKSFWIRRWFRTLPNYYLILILNFFIVYFGLTNDDITQFNWKFFLFLQNFSVPFYGFFWESWSLSIEEWFYLLFPILLAGIYLTGKNIRISKDTIFLIAILLFLLVPFSLRWLVASQYEVDNFWLETKIFKVVIFRLDGIALGLLAALISHKFPEFWTKYRNPAMIAGLVTVYVVLYSTWQPNDFSTKVFKTIIQSFGCFLMLPFFDGWRKAPRYLTKPVTHISLISYSMYLLNLGVISAVITTNFIAQNKAQAWLLYGVYWFLVILLSTLLYKFYEKPMMDLREKFTSSENSAVRAKVTKL